MLQRLSVGQQIQTTMLNPACISHLNEKLQQKARPSLNKQKQKVEKRIPKYFSNLHFFFKHQPYTPQKTENNISPCQQFCQVMH
jgi:hypothetical protein